MSIGRESSWKKRFKIGKLLKLKLSLRLKIRSRNNKNKLRSHTEPKSKSWLNSAKRNSRAPNMTSFGLSRF